jgi:hypothetical protein
VTRQYELRLDTGERAVWEGTDGEDAARRFVDAQRVAGRDVSVAAWRDYPRHGVFVLGDTRRIIG